MVTEEDDPVLDGILGSDGEFDPTNLLSQPINFDDDIDELGINIEDDGGDNAYLDSATSQSEHADSEINHSNNSYYNGEIKHNSDVDDRNSERYFRPPSTPTQKETSHRRQQDSYDHGERNGNREERLSPREYDPPPFKQRGNSPVPQHRHLSPRDKPRHSGRKSERITEVQQKIRQVQQQIHENMDGGNAPDRERKGNRSDVRQRIRQVQQQIHENLSDDDRGNRHHSYRQGPVYSPRREHRGHSPRREHRGHSPRREHRGHSPRRDHRGHRDHRDQERTYSDKYPSESYRHGDPRDRYPPREHAHDGGHSSRSYNERPHSTRERDDGYGGDPQGHHRSRSYQHPPPSQHPRSGMHPHRDPRGNDNGYGPMDRGPPMHQMRRGQSPHERPHDMPPHSNDRGQEGYSEPPQQRRPMPQPHDGMPSHQNSNGMGNPMMQQQQVGPQHMRHMSGSFNGGMQNMHTNQSNNGNMSQRGIQSMSSSLNGLNPSNGGMNHSRNGMDRSANLGIQSMSASLNGIQNRNEGPNNGNMMARPPHQQRGIQSMSASLNGMQQMNGLQSMSNSMNGMRDGYQGQPRSPQMGMPMNRSMNSMTNVPHNHEGGEFRHHQQHPGMNQMSASQNGMQHMMMNSSRNGGFPPHQQGGGHPLHGMSQSLNGAPNGPFAGGHNRSMSQHGMMTGSNNIGASMNGSMNGMMNRSNNGPMLNNSNVPSASLLSQVSNLANLPNRGGGGGAMNSEVMQRLQAGGGNSDTNKLSRKLMEAMKRTASSRKLIRELNIAAMLRNDLKSPGLSKKKSVVKAKRKTVKPSLVKTASEAAVSSEFTKPEQTQEVAT